MSDILARITADKRDHVARCKEFRPLADLLGDAVNAPHPRGFARSLAAAVDADHYGLIAEIKKASPSGGLIRTNFDPAALARAYKEGGATCLSVLTDSPYFQGKNEDLCAAHAATDLPVLRKDFTVDPYQVIEARALGADCVLLIMASLDDPCAHELEAAASEFGMDVLIEVHDEVELDRALALRGGLIGINNRNLKTLETDLATTERLAPRVPADRRIVCESGLKTPADLKRMSAVGANCFLVGESLMRQPDVTMATRALLAAAPMTASGTA